MFRSSSLLVFFLSAFNGIQLNSAFVAALRPTSKLPTTSLQMADGSFDGSAVGKKLAASAVTAAVIFSAALPPAVAADKNFAGSTQVVAARSGGRMGGRSSMGSRGRAPSSYSRTTVIRPAVRSPSVIVAPTPFYGSPFGYSPFGPFGTYYVVQNWRHFKLELCILSSDPQLLCYHFIIRTWLGHWWWNWWCCP